MTTLFSINTRMALQSIRANKTRSFLTMLGIIIGVSSVILTVSLGEGIKSQVTDVNKGVNDSQITVRSGRIVTRDSNGVITDINYLRAFGSNSLTNSDYEALQKISEAGTVSLLSTISAQPTNFDKETYEDGIVIASNEDLPEVLGQEIIYGSFFDDANSSRNIAVIGQRVAEELFQENVPLGKLINIRGQDFVVGGVFDEFDINPISPVADLNKAVFISYETAKSISDSNPSIYQFMIAPDQGVTEDQLATVVNQTLLEGHGGQQDFTVLKASETELVAQGTVSIATTFIAGIAAISLIVGGIGIMNIMFVNVTERTREIGVRKSLGATTQQIYSQFLIESTVLSIVGGVLGVMIALGISTAVGLSTELKPVVTWQIVLIAVGVSAAVGIVFGTAPAVKAARKDPIESLRYE